MKNELITKQKRPNKTKRWIGLVGIGAGNDVKFRVARTTNLIDPLVGQECSLEEIRSWMDVGVEVSFYHANLIGTPSVWMAGIEVK
jgi:hypothetical protein